jgi:hypothetical protein
MLEAGYWIKTTKAEVMEVARRDGVVPSIRRSPGRDDLERFVPRVRRSERSYWAAILRRFGFP